MIRLVLAVAAGLIAGPAMAQNLPVPEVLRHAVDDFIRPGFDAFSRTTERLQLAMHDLCADTRTAEEFEAARAGFADTVLSYSRIEALRLGPLMQDNRVDRILLWPDPRGIGLRQVQQVLATTDETATDVATLSVKSVALQGLPALEFVLHGTGAETLTTEEGDFRCRYGAAIAGSLAVIAGKMAAEWNAEDGIAMHLTMPDPAFADYRTPTEALEELAGILTHGMEQIRDTRLLPFLGREGQTPKPRSALYWRSGLTVPSVLANFVGLRALFEDSRIAEAPARLDLLDSAAFEFGNVDRAAALITQPVEEALEDPKQRAALDYLVILTRSLATLTGETLSVALGLSVGFSSLDGD